jgi:hypothetical protein
MNPRPDERRYQLRHKAANRTNVVTIPRGCQTLWSMLRHCQAVSRRHSPEISPAKCKHLAGEKLLLIREADQMRAIVTGTAQGTLDQTIQ